MTRKPIPRPAEGGSYIRQPDGSIRRAHAAMTAEPAAEPAQENPARKPAVKPAVKED